jgi:hypothetical protein
LSNWATEIETVVPDELELEALALVLAGALEDELEELQAAAARHKASDTDATAPFLAIGII